MRKRPKVVNVKHGARVGGVYPRTYIIWMGMRQRCNNPRNKGYWRYGGRGISVCPEWDDYSVFLADMGEAPPGMLLERSDNDKGYSKNNCLWATAREQQQNTKKSLRWYIHGAVYGSCGDAAVALDVGRSTIRGWCQGKGMRQREGCYVGKVYG